ncbi:response regulator transcription factor [uncultured Paludibaculum sp.]|uniref:response regulator transcription factor n=1 Tax=uncultured Paludibaculum sp. TaxID=1765020 RepID=UPI002AABACD8|nr:response regulator transcription factor [uncultured Paludibaculum sp.]
MSSPASRLASPIPTPQPIRILVVDDHPLIREGIAALVAGKKDLELVAEACSGSEGVEQFRKHRPDITLMDLQMPGMHGIDAIIAIREQAPEAAIIVLTTYSGDVQVRRALKAGAQAYLLKNLLHKDLLDTIRSVHAGRRTVSPDVAAVLADHLTDETLTDREVDVLHLIADGHANKEIAGRLSITEEAVKSRVKNILAKLQANDRTHAVMIAVKRGILVP